MDLISFRGISLHITHKSEVLRAIDSATSDSPLRIATANPEFIQIAAQNPEFKRALEHMEFVTIDGSGLFFALRIWNSLKRKHLSLQRYHGSDLVIDLCKKYQDGSKSFYLLGGKPGVMDNAAKKLKDTYPHINIVGQSDGGVIDVKNVKVTDEIWQHIQSKHPDILFVAFGAPKQELWIETARSMNVPVMIGVGGSLDFQTHKKRAPKLIRALYLEWLYRAFTEKGHWKRLYQAVFLFPVHSLIWIYSDFFFHRDTQK